jgi:hypothetical protein
MQIRTRTAVIPVEAIQSAYNEAVMSGRMVLAWEIGQLWLNVLVEQKVRRIQMPVDKRKRGKDLRHYTVQAEISLV